LAIFTFLLVKVATKQLFSFSMFVVQNKIISNCYYIKVVSVLQIHLRNLKFSMI